MKPIGDGALRVARMFDALPPKMKLRVVRVLEGQQTETRKLAKLKRVLAERFGYGR